MGAGAGIGPRQVRAVLRRLEKAFGRREWRRPRPALDQLVATILSQNTNDRNSLRGFEHLLQRFGTWDRVAAARLPQIERAIRVAGLARTKSARIRSILRDLKRRQGAYSLEFLAERSDEEAMAYLCGMPGVGPKTAACVLLFSFGRGVFPVDTHIHRVARRLGWVPQAAGRVEAQKRLQAAVPADAVYALHLLLIELGRKVCHARRPRHETCPLRSVCPSAGLRL